MRGRSSPASRARVRRLTRPRQTASAERRIAEVGSVGLHRVRFGVRRSRSTCSTPRRRAIVLIASSTAADERAIFAGDEPLQVRHRSFERRREPRSAERHVRPLAAARDSPSCPAGRRDSRGSRPTSAARRRPCLRRSSATRGSAARRGACGSASASSGCGRRSRG